MVDISEANFKELVVDSEKVVLLAFVAEWCKPSKLQKDVILHLQEKYEGRAEIHLLDVDSYEELSAEYNTRTLPTVVLFAGGEMIETLIGYQPQDFLESYLDFLLEQLKNKLEEQKQSKAQEESDAG